MSAMKSRCWQNVGKNTVYSVPIKISRCYQRLLGRRVLSFTINRFYDTFDLYEIDIPDVINTDVGKKDLNGRLYFLQDYQE